MSSSIAIIMDAVNNISDAGSSGFYMDKEKKTMRFDIVVSFDAEDRRAVYRKVIEAVGKEYPGYEMQVAMDTDFSED